jgi:dipeptidyl aminopeptidase/acylaminoacyl peptidase
MKKFILLLLAFSLTSCGAMLKNPSSTVVPITHNSPVASENVPLDVVPTKADLGLKGRVLIEKPDAIYLANWDGGSPVMIRTIVSPIPMMALSPDGTKLAYFQGNYAYVQDVKTGSVKQLNKDIIGSIGGQLRWSPDGKKIALSCSTPSDPISSICLIDTDNRNIEILIDQKSLGGVRPLYFIELQDWSRDGSKIIFTYYTPSEKGQKEDFVVYLYDISSRAIQKILDGKAQNVVTQIRSVAISPDNQILLISGIDANFSLQLFRMNLQNGILNQLTKSTIYWFSAPIWGCDSSYFYADVVEPSASPYKESTAILNANGDILSFLDLQGTVIEWIK